jgi:phosphohistidine swiveling domain-containing protein
MRSPEAGLVLFRLDSPDAALDLVGGKGASLARLATAGLPVPPGFHITTRAYHRFVKENRLADAILAAAAQAWPDNPAANENAAAQIQSLVAQGTIPGEVAELIRQAYAGLGADQPPVAVRSSATAEDLPDLSFAGQHETFLNVRGSEEVLAAVKRCWGSLWTARALGYRARQGIPAQDVSLAVVVQQLVPAEAAGILFTANPVTGARDQAVINAAWGLGEAIVGGMVTPDTFVLNKQTGVIEAQEIAEKAVMTVRLPEGTREEPVPAEKRRQAALLQSQAGELSRLGAQIEQLYGVPMDVEWALRDERLFILQARPITALPEPPTALDWRLPRPQGRYARSSVIELLPDPLSPLFATLALPLWNDAMRRLMQQIGFAGALNQALVTINDYAYYDWDVSSGRMILALPRLVPRVAGWLRRAQARWAGEARPRYAAVVGEWAARELSAASAAQLLEGAREIVRVAADHYLTIQSGILPVAYMTESLFTSAYNRFFRRRDDPPAVTFLLGFDSAPIQAEKSLYDMAIWARTQPDLAAYLASATSVEIATAVRSPSPSPIAGAESWREFCRRFAEHLECFGHAVYDLDFARSLPADDPRPLLETLKFFLSGQARNPHQRQAAAACARERAVESVRSRLKGVRRRLFLRLVRSAQRYAPLREDALADVGLGWPTVRAMLHEIGRRLVSAHAIPEREDVFWLKVDEVEAAARALDAGEPVADLRREIDGRRAAWERERAVTPPVVLPLKGGARFMGIDWSHWLPARAGQTAGDTIGGVGASPGRVAGVARVIRGPDEFSQMQPGDILVAKITTPAWTPLFALAAGVVTDVGGPLSHSSIVAREYHIPAVLGTGLATERIRSGQLITVDGDRGMVTMGG